MNNEENMLDKLRRYFDETPREQIEKDWANSKKYDEVGPTVNEFIEHNTKPKVKITLDEVNKLNEIYNEVKK